MSGVTSGLRELLGKLVAFKVNYWGESSGTGMSIIEREPADLATADVVSSALKESWLKPAEPTGEFLDEFLEPRKHIIALDIDYPAHLVDSTTPGHHHLYVEIPPVDDDVYFEFLRACAKVGLIEDGYAEVSITRGHSDLRLPWVQKPTLQPSMPAVVTLSTEVTPVPLGVPCPIDGKVDCIENDHLFAPEKTPSRRTVDLGDMYF